MDITPFDIYYNYNGTRQVATIHPCCGEDSVIDYAVRIGGKLAFAVTKSYAEPGKWVVALRNSDNEVEDSLVQEIGSAIEEQVFKV